MDRPDCGHKQQTLEVPERSTDHLDMQAERSTCRKRGRRCEGNDLPGRQDIETDRQQIERKPGQILPGENKAAAPEQQRQEEQHGDTLLLRKDGARIAQHAQAGAIQNAHAAIGRRRRAEAFQAPMEKSSRKKSAILSGLPPMNDGDRDLKGMQRKDQTGQESRTFAFEQQREEPEGQPADGRMERHIFQMVPDGIIIM